MEFIKLSTSCNLAGSATTISFNKEEKPINIKSYGEIEKHTIDYNKFRWRHANCHLTPTCMHQNSKHAPLTLRWNPTTLHRQSPPPHRDFHWAGPRPPCPSSCWPFNQETSKISGRGQRSRKGERESTYSDANDFTLEGVHHDDHVFRVARRIRHIVTETREYTV